MAAPAPDLGSAFQLLVRKSGPKKGTLQSFKALSTFLYVFWPGLGSEFIVKHTRKCDVFIPLSSLCPANIWYFITEEWENGFWRQLLLFHKPIPGIVRNIQAQVGIQD